MNKNIKLLALDIDGTIVGKDYILYDCVKNIINRLKIETNIKILLASGRMTHSTLNIADQLGINTPLIAYQGAMVKDVKNNKLLFHQPIGKEVAKEVVAEIEKFDVHINVYINDQLFIKQQSQVAKTYTSYRSISPIIVDDFNNIIDEDPPTKVLGIDTDEDKVYTLKKHLKEKFAGRLNIFGSYPMFIEIVHPDIDKGKTVFKLAKDLWNIDAKNIMAIGDGENDIFMINNSGYGVAMGNAVDPVLEIARYTTLSVVDCGTPYAIEKLIFEGAEKIL